MPAHRRRFCSRGHDTHEVGRDSGGACKGCRTIYQRQYASARLAELRAYKLAHGCQRCGYRKCAVALDFHHRDPATKSFAIGKDVSRSLAAVRAEVAKCDVLCRNCHAELHHESATTTTTQED